VNVRRFEEGRCTGDRIDGPAIGHGFPSVRIPAVAPDPTLLRDRTPDPPYCLDAGLGAGELDPPPGQSPMGKVGMAVHESRGYQRTLEIDARNTTWNSPLQFGRRANSPDRAMLPPDRVAMGARLERKHPSGPQEATVWKRLSAGHAARYLASERVSQRRSWKTDGTVMEATFPQIPHLELGAQVLRESSHPRMWTAAFFHMWNGDWSGFGERSPDVRMSYSAASFST
jgi:hypothetical protein